MSEKSAIGADTRHVIASNGYVLIRVGREHHLADVRGYAYEHRVVAEKVIGRRLRVGEIVHHRDENKQNNSPDNLEVVEGVGHHFVRHRTRGKQLRLPGEPNETVECACGCGGHFLRYDRSGRPRRYISGHNRLPASTTNAITAALKDGQMNRRDIIKMTGISARAIATCLSKLKKQGVVVNAAHGIWLLKSAHIDGRTWDEYPQEGR